MDYFFVRKGAETECICDCENIDDALIGFVREDIIDREMLSRFSSIAAKVAYVNSFFKEPYQIKDIVEYTNRIYGFPEAIAYISRIIANSDGESNE